ncbi:MAG: alpha/beta fold hydrolase [Paludisphaera borealis]|uniref:alpha/beta hydrolase n=1 Tax=Paludisphaera borealis TaxID=1387353 RepID=UPI00283F048A|nr:alpha/beta fold hydrolase [Paludisphaera borealis]MDR3618149.1 alpha/beta fold hydrolase [Paludisphaera borealis]
MVGAASLLYFLAVVALLPVVGLVGFLIFAVFRYCPVISRIFLERPVLLPLRLIPEELGESVSFPTEDGLMLSGSYFKARTPSRTGVLVYCHEFLSDRWSFAPYIDGLRDKGFDVFSFDFRNHGESPAETSYEPIQYATDREVGDLRGALAYLRSRPDHDPAGFGLFGVSRGGGTALLVGSVEADVWGVVTDGAFPTRGTMTAYIDRWAEIYVRNALLLAILPRFVYSFLGDVARRQSQRQLNCVFPSVERAVARLAPRPWLQIHGERDAYIGTDIAQALFACAREPKEQWLVADAKHNRCRELEPEAYARKLAAFVDRYAPRRPLAGLPSFQASEARYSDYNVTGVRVPSAELITNVASTMTR